MHSGSAIQKVVSNMLIVGVVVVASVPIRRIAVKIPMIGFVVLGAGLKTSFFVVACVDFW